MTVLPFAVHRGGTCGHADMVLTHFQPVWAQLLSPPGKSVNMRWEHYLTNRHAVIVLGSNQSPHQRSYTLSVCLFFWSKCCITAAALKCGEVLVDHDMACIHTTRRLHDTLEAACHEELCVPHLDCHAHMRPVEEDVPVTPCGQPGELVAARRAQCADSLVQGDHSVNECCQQP